MRKTQVLRAVVLGALLFSPMAIAQSTGSVRGTVASRLLEEPLEAAEVRIEGLGITAATDREGRFQLLRVPPGTYSLDVSYTGLPPETVEITVTSGEVTRLEVDLGAISEEVTVAATLIADSQAAALARQRAADNVMNVIASDSIGRFPDQNAAAALARVSGVSVQRDQGQERYVNLRGAPTRWTALAYDGINTPGSEGRIVRFDEIPSPLIRTAEVIKTVTPDMPAESIAGRINLITASGFDFSGWKVNGELGGGQFELGDQDQRLFSGRLSRSTGPFAFLISGSHYDRDQVTDNIENRWVVGPGDQLWPEQVDYRNYHLERENNGYVARLDFRPADQHELYLRGNYTEFRDDENRDQYIWNLEGAYLGGNQDIPGNTPTRGVALASPIQGLFGLGRYRNDTAAMTFGGTSLISDWEIAYRANYTETDLMTDLPLLSPIQTDPFGAFSVVYDYSDPDFPDIDLFDTSVGADGFGLGSTQFDTIPQSGYGLDLIINVLFLQPSENTSLAFDISRPVGTSSTLRFGSQLDFRERQGRDSIDVVFAGPLLEAVGADPIDYASFVTDQGWDTDFPERFGVSLFDNAGLRGEALRAVGTLQGAGLFSGEAAPFDSWSAEEDILAGYVMNSWQYSWGSLIAGLRVEQWNFDSFGQLQGEDGEIQPIVANNDETQFFPSVHVNVDVRSDLIFRAAFTSGTARGNYDELKPNVVIDPASRFINAGNPFLKPEEAYGLDASLEWYLPEAGIFSVGVFAKEIDDPIATSISLFDGNALPNVPVGGTGFLVQSFFNGSDGELQGLEVNYVQRFPSLGGFGFEANATFTDSEFTTPPDANGETRTTPLPATSDTTFNTSIFYEKYRVSARLSYQWRDDWLDELDAEPRLDRYWDDVERLSFSFRYLFSANLTAFFDANNLTDELGRRYVGERRFVYELEGFGRSYLLGLRVDL
ncbi:MAG: TonB-dependent receptor [Acidobacteriota bacterium]